MTLAQLSIKRPIFITCVVFLMIVVGLLSMRKLPVDMFPNINFPVIFVMTPYPGAGPAEIETQVSKPLEEEVSTLGGLKSLQSTNREGASVLIATFTLETDIKSAEQQIRDRVAAARRKLPEQVKEPIIRRVDPSEQPVAILTVSADLTPAKLYDLANEEIRPKLEQVNQVGQVTVLGGTKREIHVDLDRDKLKAHEVPASLVATRIGAAGTNVPVGKVDGSKQETVFRALGEFKDLKDIESTVVNFVGNDVPVTVGDIAQVSDGVTEKKSLTSVNGKSAILMMVFRQSGANTIRVVDDVKTKISKLNEELSLRSDQAAVSMVKDGAKPIRANVDDVREAILLGVLLTVFVVFLFLGSGRSTLITGLALPNSLIGAFILMALAGFSINVMTLLALSLTVGLLIDDAIVVRENIFRHIEAGMHPVKAAIDGTKEVSLAVIATTLTVVSVFGPIAFLDGVVGQFFKEFGFTICFAMLISLFDAMTIAPMLSAYFAGKRRSHAEAAHEAKHSRNPVTRVLGWFGRFQDSLENTYERVIRLALKKPFRMFGIAIGVFVLSIVAMKWVPKTFLPAQDFGEFMVSLDLPPGTTLASMNTLAQEVDGVIRANPEIESSVMVVGSRDGESNTSTFYLNLVSAKKRSVNTSQFKERLRKQLQPFAHANPKVKDVDMIAAGQRPFNVNIIGNDQQELERIANAAFAKLKDHPALADVDISFRPGKPEFQVVPDKYRMERLGISTSSLGMELRTQIEGAIPAVFREGGREYDIRVRLKDDQRNLKEAFGKTFVPNLNGSLVRLADVAKPVETRGPADIRRQDRGRYISISADLRPRGPGMGAAMADIKKMFTEGELKLPAGMRFVFVGQAENFQELGKSMLIAALLAVLFIYLVLASLYESFVIPFTIMLVLPLAACGAFIALFITRASFDLFSMIGCIMLLGIATKNSILLVDRTHQLVQEGVDRSTALIQAGRTRLRPILMTTLALISGMLPIALGLNEASKQRTSMGIAVIGGLISSTLLTLIVIPAAYSFIDRFRLWSAAKVKQIFGRHDDHDTAVPKASQPIGG